MSATASWALTMGAAGSPRAAKRPSRRSNASCACIASGTGPRDGHPGFNVRHFYHLARRDHGVTLSYTFYLITQNPCASTPSGTLNLLRKFSTATAAVSSTSWASVK